MLLPLKTGRAAVLALPEMDSGGDGGVDESWLGVVLRNCGYEDVLAFQGVDEGVLRAVVDFHGLGCYRKTACVTA
jgi:hypothetical protein